MSSKTMINYYNTKKRTVFTSGTTGGDSVMVLETFCTGGFGSSVVCLDLLGGFVFSAVGVTFSAGLVLFFPLLLLWLEVLFLRLLRFSSTDVCSVAEAKVMGTGESSSSSPRLNWKMRLRLSSGVKGGLEVLIEGLVVG